MIIDIVLGFAEGHGGLESVITKVCDELVKRGHRPRVFQMAPPTYREWEESLPEIYYYDPVRMGHAKSYNGEIEIFRFSLGYRKLLDVLGEPDLILATHTPVFSLVCQMAVSHLGINRPPIISWLHGPPSSFGGGDLLKYSDAHLAISKAVGNEIKLSTHNPIYIVGNPVEVNTVQKIDRPIDSTKIIYIGRLENRQKRIDLLLNSLKNISGDWELNIIGDGPDKEVLEQYAEQIGLSNKIKWSGWQDNPWSTIKEASLLVLTSDFEGFGLVLVEALSRGIPVVSTKCEGPDEIVKHWINGWLFPPGDEFALNSILKNIVNKEYPLPDEQICIESVSEYSVASVVNKIEKAIINTFSFYKVPF